MENKRKSLDMTQGDPAKLLVLFALPMLIGSIFQLMYNMVDTVVVGRYVSLDALAAIGATGTTMSFLMMVGQGMGNAVSIVISQAEGGKNEQLLKKAVAHAVYITLGSSLLVGFLAFFGASPLMKLLGTPENIIENSVRYIQIVGGLTIAQQCYNGATSILRAIGDSKTPLYFLIFSSLLNVALDLLFVLKLDGGVAGVAYATVLSQAVSAVLCISYMLKRFPRLLPSGALWRFDKNLFKQFLGIGVPMTLQSMALSVGMFVITAVINSHGSGVVASYTIGGKVEQLAIISFSNMAFSFSVFSGQNFGAKLYARIKEGLIKGLTIICSLAVLSGIVMLIFARPIAMIFMDAETLDPQVLTDAVSMVRTEAILYWALGTIWTVNSALRGMGIIKVTIVSSVVELLSKIGFSLSLPLFFGTLGIWMAGPFGWVLGLIPSAWYLARWFKKHPAAEEEIPSEA